MGRPGSSGVRFVTEILFCLLASIVITFFLIRGADGKVRYQVAHIPAGHPTVVEGEEVRYYTLEQYKLLLKLDRDLTAKMAQLEIFQKTASDYEEVVTSYQTVLDSKDRQMAIYMDRSDRLFEKWGTCEEELARTQDRFSWSSFGIGVVVGGSLVAVTFSALLVYALAS